MNSVHRLFSICLARLVCRHSTVAGIVALLLSAPAGIVAQDQGSEQRNRTSRKDLSREGVIDALERGTVALEAIDRLDAADMLRRITDEYVNQGKNRRTDSDRGDRERAIARKQLETIRLARKALLEADRPDAADILQRTIRAREVGLEGRRDEEAREIRRNAPELGAQIEILALASRLWREFGHEEKAATVGQLAEQMQARFHRDRDHQHVVKRRERDHDANNPNQRLSAQIRDIRRQLERLERQVEELRHHDDHH